MLFADALEGLVVSLLIHEAAIVGLDLGLGHGLITVLSESLHQVLRENDLQFGAGGDKTPEPAGA